MPDTARGASRVFRTRPWWVTLLVGLAVVVLVALPFVVRPSAGFEGTDAAATATLEERGARPWVGRLFEPGSPEVESGLFALQAGIGGAVLGYVVGRLHGRSRAARGAMPDASAPAGETDRA